MKNLENDLSNNSDRINELNNKLEKYIFNINTNFGFLVYNNSDIFKNIFQVYYNRLKQKSNSNLFTNEKEFKNSYNIIIDLIYDNLTGKNGDDSNKVIEFKLNYDYKKYKEYTIDNWNWFLINNVLFQMMFSNNIELNENGVEQTLNKIYELRSEFKEDFEFDLNWAKRQIEDYVTDYEICKIIKGIKEYIMPKNNLLSNLEKYLLA